MVIAGAGGHAKEILGVLAETDVPENLFFYDDIFANNQGKIFERYPILRNEQELKEVFKYDSRFIIGIGSPRLRYQLAHRLMSYGGILTSVISSRASVGMYDVKFGDGLNVMQGAVLTENIVIGEGSLIHVHASVHHDCRIGSYCEILPGSHVLGKVVIGDFTSVGSGAILLPNIHVGSNVIIGAGAVVTRNLPEGSKVKGVPAR